MRFVSSDTAPVEKAHMEDEWLGVVVNSYGKGQKVVVSFSLLLLLIIYYVVVIVIDII